MGPTAILLVKDQRSTLGVACLRPGSPWDSSFWLLKALSCSTCWTALDNLYRYKFHPYQVYKLPKSRAGIDLLCSNNVYMNETNSIATQEISAQWLSLSQSNQLLQAPPTGSASFSLLHAGLFNSHDPMRVTTAGWVRRLDIHAMYRANHL